MSNPSETVQRVAAWLRERRAVGLEWYEGKNTRTTFFVRPGELDSLDVRRAEARLPRAHAAAVGESPPVPKAFEPLLDGARCIYAAPHGSLHGRPLHAERLSTGDCLGDLAPVLLLPRLSDLASSARAPRVVEEAAWCHVDHEDRELWVGGGSDLCGALRGRCTEPTATLPVDEMLAESARFRWIVWFCHGVSVPERPERGFLRLSGGRRLSFTELRGTDVRFDGCEVLLLACGRSAPQLTGDRRPSLAVAFLELGASLVVDTIPVVVEAAITSAVGKEYVLARWAGIPPANAWDRAWKVARQAATERVAQVRGDPQAFPDEVEREIRGLWSPFVAYGTG
jgi:CHAT domain-containing protein